MRFTLAALSALALFSPAVDAFFKMNIDNILVQERSDPLISPGTVSMHTHTVFGGSNFGPNSTYESLRASECTSARAKEDKSAYWTPAMYIQWKNGTFAPVPYAGGGGLIYYLFRTNTADQYPIQAFPPGFRMLTGNPFARTYYQSGAMKDAIGWNCLGSPSPTRIEGSGLPINKACSGNLRGEIRFPSCWDGKTLYAKDGSHVAYPTGGEAGPCPAGWPRRLPTLFYEISFYVQAMEPYRQLAMNPAQPFVLAMGDATGQGWHGDFQNGWKDGLLDQALKTCLSPTSGSIEECTILELYDRTVDKSCKRTTIWNELVVSPNLPKLPGCNPITTTEAAARAVKCILPVPAKLASQPTVYTGDVPPAGTAVLPGTPTFPLSAFGYKYQGCYADSQSSRTFAKQLTTPLKTVASCLTTAKAAGWTWAALEYGGECWVGKSAPKSGKLEDGRCGMVCTGLGTSYCGGSAALQVYKLTTAASKIKRHFESQLLRH